jgi:hypothetical protein
MKRLKPGAMVEAIWERASVYIWDTPIPRLTPPIANPSPVDAR